MNWRSIAGAVGALALCGAPSVFAQIPAGVVVPDQTGACPSGNVLNTGNDRPVYGTSKGALCTSTTATISGNLTAVGPTANGSPAANPPVLVGGTSNGTATGNVGNLKVDSSGVASVNTAQVNGVTTLTGAGASGTGAQRVTVSQDSTTVAGSASLPAGANLVGKVGIDQTTPGSTNGVNLAPSSAAGVAIAPTTTSAVASNQVLKAAAGNGYRYALVTGATAGFLMVFDATSAPGDGAVTPKICSPAPANARVEIDHTTLPDRFATGITEVFSTTGCFTKTASATAEFEGTVQ